MGNSKLGKFTLPMGNARKQKFKQKVQNSYFIIILSSLSEIVSNTQSEK